MKNFIILMITLMVILSSSISSASEKIIEASGDYIMDSRLDETSSSATARAREEAKRSVVEKAGVYIQSYSKIINLELDTDEVKTVAARLIKIQKESSNIEVVEKNLLKFTVTIEAIVDDLDDNTLKAILQDKQRLEELTRRNKELQEKYDALNEQMKQYRNKFDTANDTEKIKIKEEVTRNVKKFSAIEEFARGNDFFSRKDYTQALISYDNAIELDSQLAEVYNNRGIVKYELHQFKEAVEDYTVAINLRMNYVDALNNRGNAYAVLGLFSNAAKDLKTALKINDKSVSCHNNLGSVYFSLKKFDLAIEEYTRAIQLDSTFAEAYYNRAVTWYAKKNLGKALVDITQAFQLNQNDPSTKELLKKITNKTTEK